MLTGMYKLESFLAQWEHISTIIIALITAFIAIIVPLFIYKLQIVEKNERIKQGIISVIEETEKECEVVREVLVLCLDVEILAKNLSGEDMDTYAIVQIAKSRLSEFKKNSKKVCATNRIRKFETILIENQNKKFSMMNKRKKVKVKDMKEKLLSIYTLLEVNHNLRKTVLQKIPEIDVVINNDCEVVDNNKIISSIEIKKTFNAIEKPLSDLINNSKHIIEIQEQLKAMIN